MMPAGATTPQAASAPVKHVNANLPCDEPSHIPHMAKPLPKARSLTPVLRDRLFFFNYEKNPQPVNITTLVPTTTFADPRSSHPYHIRTTRRLDQFDPTKLHWSVAAPVDLSKSVLVRRTAGRRVREAFRQELHRAGWNSDGQRRPEGGSDGNVRDFDLRGALRLGLVKEAFAVTATSEEVRQSASWAVKTLSGLHSRDKPQQRRPSKYDPDRKGAGDRAQGVKTQSVPIRRISHR